MLPDYADDYHDWLYNPPLHPEYEVRQLRKACDALERENESLRRENGELLHKWITTQGESTNRMVLGMLAAISADESK